MIQPDHTKKGKIQRNEIFAQTLCEENYASVSSRRFVI